MRRKKLEDFFEQHRKIGLDTSVFIFEIEGNPKYIKLANPIFVGLDGPKGQAVTSTITMLELLVQPYRLSDIDLVNKLYALLSTYPHLERIEPTLEIVDRGARLWAEYNLKTPDALRAATAVACQATGFISNDTGFKRVGGLEVLILDEMLLA